MFKIETKTSYLLMFRGAARQIGLLFGGAKLAAYSSSNFCHVKPELCLP